MANLASLKVSSRLRLRALVSLAVFTIVVWEAISSFNEVLAEERAIKTQHVVESAHGVIVEFHARELAGELTRDEAQKGAMATIKRLRDGGDEYFWINDMHPRMVMHPIRPELDGKDLRENKDPTGKHLFVEFVDAVRKSGAGFVEYMWPRPGSSEPQPKISYVKGFDPWGWVIGSGVYTSDLAAVFWQHASHTLILAVVGLGCMLGLSWAIGRSILGQLGGEPTYLQQIAGHIAARDLTTHVKVAPGDTRSITFAVEQIQGKLAERTGAATAQISQVIVSVKAETESAVASIEQIVPKVESGARLSKEAAEALRQIREGAHDTLERLEDVVSSMKELSASSNGVATNMQEVAEMAERSCAEIRGSAESSERLKHSAEALEHLTDGFRVG